LGAVAPKGLNKIAKNSPWSPMSEGGKNSFDNNYNI